MSDGWCRTVLASRSPAARAPLLTWPASRERCVHQQLSVPGNKLKVMEQLHHGDNSPVIEVLDGQMSVEELLADLGFDWHPQPAEQANTAAVSFSQPPLF
jgi:hypothetical protein